jgi:hypothetical protein
MPRDLELELNSDLRPEGQQAILFETRLFLGI